MWSLQESHYKHITVDELLFNEIVNYLKQVLKVFNKTQRGFFCTIIVIFDYLIQFASNIVLCGKKCFHSVSLLLLLKL